MILGDAGSIDSKLGRTDQGRGGVSGLGALGSRLGVIHRLFSSSDRLIRMARKPFDPVSWLDWTVEPLGIARSCVDGRSLLNLEKLVKDEALV
jgi:hypothetical protein